MLRSAFLIGCLIAVGACSDDAKQVSGAITHSCGSDDECQASELCVFRLCRARCEGQDACSAGLVCLQTERGGACTRLQDNACAGSADCPLGSKCAFGRCLIVCSSHDRCGQGMRCVTGLCQPQDFSMTNPSAPDAAVASTSDGGAGQAPPSAANCPEGSVRCQGNAVARCDKDGHSQLEAMCPFTCREGACGGVCKPDEHRCDAKARQLCSAAGQWQGLETCRNLCTPNACTDTCQEGNTYCNGRMLMVCRSGQPQPQRQCPYVCSEAACAGNCSPGSKQCSGAGVATCSAEGEWSAPVSCGDAACEDGACTGTCKPGAKRCASAGSYEVCNDKGQWDGASALCPGQACVAGACTGSCSPDAARCVDDHTLATCRSDGNWEMNSCGDGACVSGECRGVCSPGARRCKGSSQQLQTCSSEGSWQDGPVCSGQACVAGECRGVCAPGALQCSQDQRGHQNCASNGSWGSVTACAGSARCTGAGVCAAESTCQTGQSPDWYSASGSDTSLEDTRWSAAQPATIQVGNVQLSYRILVDRSAGAPGELAVSIRILPAGADSVGSGDNVYFGIGVDGSGAAAHSIAIDLGTLEGDTNPHALTQITQRDTFGANNAAWSAGSEGAPAWLKHAALWLDTGGAAWAVNFRVDLSAIGGSELNALRIALGAHVSRSSGGVDLVASSDSTTTYDGLQVALPATWLRGSIAANTCVANLPLTH